MIMRNLSFILPFISLLLLSCNKDEDTISSPTCSDTPPQDELCQAAFSRWFYDQSTNSCSQIGYSGCSQKGFASLEECEECKCH